MSFQKGMRLVCGGVAVRLEQISQVANTKSMNVKMMITMPIVKMTVTTKPRLKTRISDANAANNLDILWKIVLETQILKQMNRS
jgi:hypothetical protein